MDANVRPSLIDLAQEPAFRLSGLRVLPTALEVEQDGRREVLQPRVMQVLVALARRRGEVVSRDELIQLCWGRVVGDDAVNRCIVLLRHLGRTYSCFEIATVATIGYRLIPTETEAAESPPTPRGPVTIAVLPFVNMSPDPEQEYFSDGLAEELMAQLGQMPELRVTGRSSSFTFKGRNDDLRVVGETLGVAHVLEGSVRRAGARLRITAHLVKCADGFQLWSETYDRELGDVFAIQEEVARAVTRALGVKLAAGAPVGEYGGTANFEAFDHFLKAGRLLLGISFDEVDGRLRHLRLAVAIDPNYALAWANLSCMLAFRQAWLPMPDGLRVDPEREAAAARALALAPGLAAANVAAGWMLGDMRKWRAADERISFALACGSGADPVSETTCAGFLTVTGRVREGLAARQVARDADPLSLGCSTLLMRTYAMLEMWAQFDAEYERSQELAGAWREAEFLQLIRLLRMKADAVAVGRQFERAAASGLPFLREVALAHGATEKVREVLGRYLSGATGLIHVAQLAGAYRQTDLALDALTRAEPAATMQLFQYCWSPELREVRQDPWFKDLMRTAGLAQFWRETGKWPDFCRPVGEADFEVVG